MALTEGYRVVVPFGGRTVEGFVIGIKDTTDLRPNIIRPVIRLMDDYPALTEDQLTLARYMQAHCKCRLSSALRLMIPAEMRGGRVGAKQVRRIRLILGGAELSDYIESQKRAHKRVRLLEYISGHDGDISTAELDTGYGPAIKYLAEAGVIEVYQDEVRRAPQIISVGQDSKINKLTPTQHSALNELTSSSGGRFLLHGVTGSGKTEVYIDYIQYLMEQGKSAILLVPEISLTPQMAERFNNRFGSMCALLHSRLSAGERYDEWRRIRCGEAKIVIGARSAVFAPVENLGAIIIDEEHESSYQSDSYPIYDAREIAQCRCEINGATLLLGSATPTISAYMRTMPTVQPQNRLTLIEMPDRVNRRPLPQVSIVDMRTELLRGNRSVFSNELKQALEYTVEAGDQAILFLNRRGHSTFVSCRSCGYVEKCANCDVSMTYHQYDDMLRCHYCGAERKPHKVCPECGSPYIKFFGTGTQKVESELNAMFPNVGVLRMDADTTAGKNAHAKLLQRFSRREAQILVGTQMVAKGLDFPNVTLVGVIAADSSLNLPDYRAFERTFQLLTQAAGRSGRADKPGRVIVQTYEPDHYAVQLAAAQDYRAFFMQESNRRRQGLYPPFTIIARLLIDGQAEEAVKQKALDIEADFNKRLDAVPDMRGQIVQMRALEAPLKQIRGRFRWQVFAKLYARGKPEAVLDCMAELEHEYYDDKSDLNVTLEINPTSIL